LQEPKEQQASEGLRGLLGLPDLQGPQAQWASMEMLDQMASQGFLVVVEFLELPARTASLAAPVVSDLTEVKLRWDLSASVALLLVARVILLSSMMEHLSEVYQQTALKPTRSNLPEEETDSSFGRIQSFKEKRSPLTPQEK
jgi:hypothetical protein